MGQLGGILAVLGGSFIVFLMLNPASKAQLGAWLSGVAPSTPGGQTSAPIMQLPAGQLPALPQIPGIFNQLQPLSAPTVSGATGSGT